MPPDIALSDASMPWAGDRPRAQQPWGDKPHGPVFTIRLLDRTFKAWAWCYQCHWEGPDRSGDPNSLRLVEDDAVQHYHAQGARCGLCEVCRPAGALRPRVSE